MSLVAKVQLHIITSGQKHEYYALTPASLVTYWHSHDHASLLASAYL